MLNTQDIHQREKAVEERDSGVLAIVSDYIALTKPGIMALLLVTTLGAMLVAAAGAPPFWLIVITLLGGWMTAGGANAFNCVIDRDIDAQMPRTRKRGTASGRISAMNGALFAGALTLGGFLLLGLFVNWVAAWIALAGNFYYVVIYTLILKRRTAQNIVIGGAAGAMPPLVGWAAVTGNITAAAWILFAIVFYWTPPHFWSLALLKQGEYGRVGMPMLPNVAGEDETRKQIVLYTVMLVAVSMLLQPFGMSWIYFVGALALGGWFLKLAIQLLINPSKALARKTFFYSIWYMAGIFFVMSLDRLVLG
jgi:protoheme IX farnesyltransferase